MLGFLRGNVASSRTVPDRFQYHTVGEDYFKCGSMRYENRVRLPKNGNQDEELPENLPLMYGEHFA